MKSTHIASKIKVDEFGRPALPDGQRQNPKQSHQWPHEFGTNTADGEPHPAMVVIGMKCKENRQQHQARQVAIEVACGIAPVSDERSREHLPRFPQVGRAEKDPENGHEMERDQDAKPTRQLEGSAFPHEIS